MTDITLDGIATWLSNWFQEKLVSGTNIKTVNNQSLLGSGNLDVGGSVTVDDQLSSSSTNPVQNRVINTALDVKAPISHASTAGTHGLGSTSEYGHVKTINDLAQSIHQDGTALSAYQGNVLKGFIDEIHDLLADTGWIDVLYSTGWTNYNTDNKLQYRRFGKIVEVRGWAKPSSNKSGTSFIIATITNTSCRPSSDVIVYNKGFSNYHFQTSITSNGDIAINKFYNGTTSQSQVTTSQVFLIQATYIAE